MKHLLSLLTVLLLAGCMGSGYGWNQEAPPAPAQAAPSSLSPALVMGNPGVAPPQAPYTGPTLTVGGEKPVPPPAADLHTGPVKVALLVPLTGSHADIGQALLQSAQLALFDMGSHSFELMPQDTGNTPQGAEKAASAAIADGAQLILGPLFAAQVKAVAPVAGRAGINVIAFSTDWSLAGGNTYIMGFVPFGQVQRIVDYAASQGIRRIGVLAPADEYGNAVMNAYNTAAAHAGVTTINVVRFQSRQTDFTDMIGKFSDYDARAKQIAASPGGPQPPAPFDAVLIAAGGDQARTIGNMLATDNLGPGVVRRLGTGLWDDTGLSIEPGMQGAWFAAPSPDLRATFEKRYAESYGAPPPRLATLAYDATALAAVLARNGSGADMFSRAALTNANGFAGLDGVFRFLPSGLAERGLGVLTFRGGTIAVQDPAPHTFQQWTQ